MSVDYGPKGPFLEGDLYSEVDMRQYRLNNWDALIKERDHWRRRAKLWKRLAKAHRTWRTRTTRLAGQISAASLKRARDKLRRNDG